MIFKNYVARRWWRTPLIPALGKQRQADLYEFEVSLVYKSWFRERLQSHREPLSQKNKNKTKQKKNYVYMCVVCACMRLHVLCACRCPAIPEAVGALELELQAVVSLLM